MTNNLQQKKFWNTWHDNKTIKIYKLLRLPPTARSLKIYGKRLQGKKELSLLIFSGIFKDWLCMEMFIF